ncbi:MAG: hypothetical protein MK135_11050, partial [Polyangiaceae bacterium]|nr:hypothetical protein [Polyangiaceae bacterium]
IARTRVFFYGRFTDWFTTLLRVGATNNGNVRFEQVYADFSWRNFTLRVGQWYLNLFQEQFLSPDSTLTINPSAVGGVFDGGQVQGAQVWWDLPKTRFQLATSNGARSAFAEVGTPAVADIAFSARVQTILGDSGYARFSTGSSFRGEGVAVLFGASGHYQIGGGGDAPGVEIAQGSTDLSLEYQGFNLHTSIGISWVDAPDEDPLATLGFVTQGGIFIFDWTELYLRFEALASESKTESGVRNQTPLFTGVTGGFNQYFWPERGIRLQADCVYYPTGTEGTLITPNANAGLLLAPDSQWSFRVQLNLPF